MNIPTYLPNTQYGASPRGMGPALDLPPRWIVIHDTSNTAPATAEVHYAATRTDDRGNWTSAHFYVDPSAVLGSVPLDHQAWAAFPNANEHGWHIEMCGLDAGSPGAVSPETLARTAGLVAQLAELAGLPVRHVDAAGIAAGERGITGHLDFTLAEHRTGGHTDPGPRFDWDHFLGLVDARLTGYRPTPTPQPKGDPMFSNWITVKRGSTGDGVRVAQGLLLARGYSVGSPSGVPDGEFGPMTEQSTRVLQAAHGIQVDGEFGPHTLSVAVFDRDLA